MAITDLANNPLTPATTGNVFGFEASSSEDVLPLEAYNFIVKTIRDQDRENGNLFLKRFLDGGQQVWEDTQKKIASIKDLWSVEDCPDEFLPYLKNIVGWTRSLEHITDRLDADTLRRLIDSSVKFWKTRGPETTLADFLTFFTGARVRVWNYFDFQSLTDEDVLGQDNRGIDAWLIDHPGAPTYEENLFNVRIVDEGDLDRELVKDVVRLQRPSGERIEISYLAFLDRFTSEGDSFQWERVNGSDRIVVTGGNMELTAATEELVKVNRPNVETLEQFSYYARICVDTVGGVFTNFIDDQNYYFVKFNANSNTVELRKMEGGAESLLGSFDYTTIGEAISTSAFYGVRVTVTNAPTGKRIKVYIDAAERIVAVDGAHGNGAIGVYHPTGSTLKVDEAEVIPAPMDTDTIAINT